MRIRPIQEKDRYEWLRLRGGLWPKEADLSGEVTRYFTGDLYSVAEVFVLDCGQGRLGGFIEVSLRNYAEGSVAPKVPYVEGWYVEKSRRGQGWGKQLMQAAEGWAKSVGSLSSPPTPR